MNIQNEIMNFALQNWTFILTIGSIFLAQYRNETLRNKRLDDLEAKVTHQERQILKVPQDGEIIDIKGEIATLKAQWDQFNKTYLDRYLKQIEESTKNTTQLASLAEKIDDLTKNLNTIMNKIWIQGERK